MSEEMNLVRDLAVILISAGVFTIISRALKQPLVLGYIIAGVLIGPNVDFFFGISSNEAVHEWSEIGLIFMMFGLGLEFSFKKLLKVGSGALVTAGSKFVGVFILGYITGQALGWTSMESIFLGGLLSMSSTAVVLKSYDDMGLKDKPYAGMVFGTLVVEDLIAILLMVLLSTLAVSKEFEGKEMLFNLTKLGFFLILWFLVGIYVIPTLLKKTRKYLNDEILLIVSIGLCFGMVTLATAVGFSSALGAFVMGSILAETIESEHIGKLVSPIKDLFGAIFFISVGMMVSPSVIIGNWAIILVLTLFVMLTHIIFSAAGIILSGGGVKNAVHTGFSLAQLGEFGFIIAGVGVSLGVMRDFIYPVIIAVSVITTFTTPYMIKLAPGAYNLLEKKLPPAWLERINSMERKEKRTVAEQSEWKKYLKPYALRLVLYGVILMAIIIASKAFLEPLVAKVLPSLSTFWKNLISCVITLAVMSPFFLGLASNSDTMHTSMLKLRKEKESNIWPLIGLSLLRTFIAIGFIMSVISSHFNLAGWTIILILIAAVTFMLIARKSFMKNIAIEKQFITNLNEKEILERRKTPVAISIRTKMAGYDVHIEPVDISADSSFVGLKMKEIPFRSESGANIIKIQRGSKNIVIPGGDVVIYPNDRLLAVGSTEQLKNLRKMINSSLQTTPEPEQEFNVVPIILEADSYLTGSTLRDVSLRDYGCMVVSVLRGDEIITNPRPDFHFAEGDTVWIAGDISSLDWISN